jgi:hypothetical protein
LPFIYEKSKCFEYGLEQKKSKLLDFFEFLINMAIPYIIIFIINISLLWNFNVTSRQKSNTNELPKIQAYNSPMSFKRTINLPHTNGSLNNEPLYRHGSYEKELRNQNKLTISLTTILCLLLICHLPSFLLEEIIVETLYGDFNKSELAFRIKVIGTKISHFLTYINCSANMIIYCVSNEKFLNGMKHLFTNTNNMRSKRLNQMNVELGLLQVNTASNLVSSPSKRRLTAIV